MGALEPDRSNGPRMVWPISRRFHLRSAIITVAIVSVPLALILPRIHIPGEAETNALRIVAKHYATRYSKNPDILKATRLPDGGWTVEATSILNPERGGYRTVDTFQVDVQGRCHWISLHAWGSY